jgi:hypothetical protein
MVPKWQFDVEISTWKGSLKSGWGGCQDSGLEPQDQVIKVGKSWVAFGALLWSRGVAKWANILLDFSWIYLEFTLVSLRTLGYTRLFNERLLSLPAEHSAAPAPGLFDDGMRPVLRGQVGWSKDKKHRYQPLLHWKRSDETLDSNTSDWGVRISPLAPEVWKMTK